MAQSNTRRAPQRLIEGTPLRLPSLPHPSAEGRLLRLTSLLAPSEDAAPAPRTAPARMPATRAKPAAVSSPRTVANRPANGPKSPGKPVGMARPTVVLLPAPPTIKRPMSRPVFLPEPQPLPAGYTPAVKPADFLRWMAARERPDWRRRFHPMKILALGLGLSSMILGFAGGARLSAAGKTVLRPAAAHAAVVAPAGIAPTSTFASAPDPGSPAQAAGAPPLPKRGVIIEPLVPKYAEAVVHVQIAEAVVLRPQKKLWKKTRGKRGKARAARRPRR